MSFLITHSISEEILSVCWVNCFQKRERDKRDVPIIWRSCYSFTCEVCSDFCLWGCISQRMRNAFPLWGHRKARECTESKCTARIQSPAKPPRFFLEGHHAAFLSPSDTPTICLGGSLEQSRSWMLWRLAEPLASLVSWLMALFFWEIGFHPE